MTRIRCTFRSYFLRLTLPLESGQEPRRDTSRWRLCLYALFAWHFHATACRWPTSSALGFLRLSMRQLECNLNASRLTWPHLQVVLLLPAHSINSRSCLSHGQNTCSADPRSCRPSPTQSSSPAPAGNWLFEYNFRFELTKSTICAAKQN